MKRRLTAAGLALLVFVGILTFLQTRSTNPRTYLVTADVVQAPNLFEGGRVMVRGVDVGRIAAVEPRPDAVRLTLEIQDGVKIPADARLSVVPITVISDRYVQFFPAYRGGPVLANGDHLEVGRTTIPAELDEVLAQLEGFLAALEPRGERRGPLARLIGSLDRAISGRSEDISGSLEGSATVLENLADSSGDMTELIRNLDRLFLTLASRSSELAIVNERFALVARSLADDQRHLEGTVENLALLADETAGLLKDSGDDLGRSFGRLGTVLRRVLRHEKEIVDAVRWTNVIAETFGATDAGGRGLFAYSGRLAEPGTEGASYNYRLDARDTIACERIEEVVAVLQRLPREGPLLVKNVLESLLAYIPDEYDRHLAFLLRDLILVCSDVPKEPPLGPRATAEVRSLYERLGEERFMRLLARYLAGGGTE